MRMFFKLFALLGLAWSLSACMGSPEDLGGFQGQMPSRPEPCSAKDPNAANNPACNPIDPPPPVVPGFAISAGSHFATSTSLQVKARTAGSFVTPGKTSSSNYVLRVGLQRETFDLDGN